MSTQRFYLNAVRAFIFITLFSPLVISGEFYFPFIVVKTIFFQIAVECALFFYILLCVSDSRYVPKFDALAKSLCAFFSVYVLASMLGMDPARSFLGTYERMLGVVNLTHFIIFFFIVKSVFTTGKDWLVLLRVFLGVSVLLSLYGVLQKIGSTWSFVYHANIDRIDATIGNSAFVAGYLIFALFFALLILAKDTNAYSRYFAFFSLALNTVIIYFTGTRAAVLALGMGFALLCAAYLFKKDIPAQTKKNTILSFAGVVVFILVAVFLLAGKEGAVQYYKRFTSISLSDATVKTRILAAKSSWEGFMAHPLLGWGPENYNLVFDKYYNPKIYPMENWFDHAHNIFFDIATTMGVAGLAAYFFLIGHLVWKGISRLRSQKEEFWVGMLIAVLVVTYFIQNLFVFDSLVTYLPLMLVLAFASAGFPLSLASPAKQKDGKEKKNSNPSFRIAVMSLPVLILVMYFSSIRPALGSYFTVQALKAEDASADEAIANFSTAIGYSSFGRHEIRGKIIDYTVSYLYHNQNSREEDGKKLAVYTMQEMEKTIQEAPLDFRNYLYYADYLGQERDVLGKAGVDALRRADDLLKMAQPLGPDKQILYLQWARIKLGQGDYTGALAFLKKLEQMTPGLLEVQIKSAYAYSKLGEPQNALPIYYALLSRQGLVVQDYIEIAVGLAGAGDKKGAIAAAQKIMELDPTMKEKAQNFISSLK